MKQAMLGKDAVMSRWRQVGVALVMGVALVGCTPEAEDSTMGASVTVPVVSATPSPSWTGKAQAAVDAVQAQIALWATIGHDPVHEDPDKMWLTSVDPEATGAIETFERWRNNGVHLVGAPRFEPRSSEKTMTDGKGTLWQVRGCYVITGSYLADTDGNEIPTEGRKDRAFMRYGVLETKDGKFFVTTSEYAEGSC